MHRRNLSSVGIGNGINSQICIVDFPGTGNGAEKDAAGIDTDIIGRFANDDLIKDTVNCTGQNITVFGSLRSCHLHKRYIRYHIHFSRLKSARILS